MNTLKTLSITGLLLASTCSFADGPSSCSPNDIDCWIRYSNNHVYAQGNDIVPTLTNGNVTRLTSVTPSGSKNQYYPSNYISMPSLPGVPYIPMNIRW